MALKQRDQVDSEDDAAPEGGEPADRATRFIARLDTYLPTLADDAARQAFLDRQLAGWEHRYSRFIVTEGASEPVSNTIAREEHQGVDGTAREDGRERPDVLDGLGRQRPDANPPQAADFLLTITALAARRNALGERARAHA